MRIDRLDLTRFGRFTEKTLDFPCSETDFHIIYGPNEAGKSTLFAAWLDLLYGIPLKTRHAFLHEGKLMQIGARLSHSGGAQEIVRLKRNGQSLLDPSGAPLPETLIASLTGGLTRENYAAMFSLDDQTIETGGEAILTSKGELGQMLFAASAGLGDLSPRLEEERRALEAFHKPRGQKTGLREARDRLAAIDRDLKEVDITAPKVAELRRKKDQAEAEYQTALEAERALQSQLDRWTQHIARAGDRARLSELQAALAPMAHLPRPDPAGAKQAQNLREALAGATARRETLAQQAAKLAERQARVQRDPAILPLADQIARAKGLQPLAEGAMADLPRRRESHDVLISEALRLLGALGLAGAPQDHALAPDRISALRHALTQRGSLVQGATTARTEAQRASQSLEAQSDPGTPPDVASLAKAIAALRASDPEAAVTRAENAAHQAQAALARALTDLAPWQGDLAALRALAVPADWTLDDAAQKLETAKTARQAAEQGLSLARESLARATPAAPAAPLPLEAAAQARQRRESLWAAHRAALTAETAEAFEAALRLDDQITQTLAEALAAARSATAAEARRAAAAQDLAEAEATLRQAIAFEAESEASATALATKLGLPPCPVVTLRLWLQRRATALAAASEAEAQTRTLAQAQTARSAASADLAALLGAPIASLDALLIEAKTRLDGAARQSAAATRYAEARHEAQTRARAASEAEAALTTWAEGWTLRAACPALSDVDPFDPGLPERVEHLARLADLTEKAAALADRIGKMEKHEADFAEALASIAEALALPGLPLLAALDARLSRAQAAETESQTCAAEIADTAAALRDEEAEAQRIGQTLDALARDLGAQSVADLADHLAACQRAEALRREAEALTESLAKSAQEPPEGDPETLRHALAAAKTRSEEALALRTTLRNDWAKVGGDDAAARKLAERTTELLALREAAEDHLARKLALTAFELALRRYRDTHRSAMLARASEAFSDLTLGAYRGLATQADGPRETLVAVAAEGATKTPETLSKGTQFQLYLALRIAGYHETAQDRPPVPFIADDIIETFDEDRAAATLRLMAEMSRKGQVIYLTHHRHLCEIAKTVCPTARQLAL